MHVHVHVHAHATCSMQYAACSMHVPASMTPGHSVTVETRACTLNAVQKPAMLTPLSPGASSRIGY